MYGLFCSTHRSLIGALVATVLIVSASAQSPVPSGSPDSLPPPRRGSSQLRKLDVPAESARTLATKLSLKFRDTPGISITPDPSRGKLVVMAPANLHPEIESDLQQLLQTVGQTEQARVALTHISVSSLEQLLEGLSKRPIASTTRGGGSEVVLNMASIGLPASTLKIDRNLGHVVIDAPADQVAGWKRVIAALDMQSTEPGQTVQIVRIIRAELAPIQRAVRLLSSNNRSNSNSQNVGSELDESPQKSWNDNGLNAANYRAAGYRKTGVRRPVRPVAMQQNRDGGSDNAGGNDGNDAGGNDGDGGDGGDADSSTTEGGGVFRDVQVEFVPELGQAIIRGSKKDVQRVREVIRQIEELSEVTKPDVEVVPLEYVDSTALADLLRQIYDDVLSARQGEVSVTALDNPNSLLLIGRTEAIRSLMDLIDKLDQPTGESDRLKVFRLQHASALDAETQIREFFVNRPGSEDEQRPGLGVRVRVQADYRTNSIIVSASPRDLQEVARLINELDVLEIPAESQLKVFQLSNAVAEDLQQVIQDAISGEVENANPENTVPSSTLSILSVNAGAGGILQSGILAGAVVTADPNSNALVVRAPATSMPLISELIRQLDQAPGVESLVKVFTIENGDALQLTAALQDLFGTDATTSGTSIGAGNLGGLPSATASSESSLVPLRFSTDQRTNSIIATGSSNDLEVVESILLRLDTSGFAERITEVVWLRHQPASNIATALQTYIQQRTQTVNAIQQFQQGLGVYDLPDRDLIVVAEPTTNSLLISVAPRLYEDVRRLVDQLDRRPPMVLIKVVIAEVSLNDAFEIGGELGLQDSLVFDRSVGAAALGNTTNSGFNFNNNGTANSVQFGQENTAARGLSTFGVGTTNTALGFGGFVLSAASESVSLLLRTLQNANRLQILSRPQIMTLDNNEGFVQVGRQIARVTGVINNGISGTQVVTQDIEVGLILRVLPRVGADGLIVMEIDATRSQRDDANGTPVPTGDGGTVVINDILRTTAQSTIAAYSGQTVVFGGLIQKTRSNFSRRVPFVADIPIVGYLFKYDQEQEARNELLVIMTPTLVTSDQDLEYVKQVESSRMSWCLADVVEMHGDVGLSGGYGLWGPAVGQTIYPDLQPTMEGFAGSQVAPNGMPYNETIVNETVVGESILHPNFYNGQLNSPTYAQPELSGSSLIESEPGAGNVIDAAQSQMYPSQMQPSQMYPSQMYPSQMQPSQMQPSQMHPSQMYPSQGYPSQMYPSQGYPSQMIPSQGYPPQGPLSPSVPSGSRTGVPQLPMGNGVLPPPRR